MMRDVANVRAQKCDGQTRRWKRKLRTAIYVRGTNCKMAQPRVQQPK